MFPVDLSSGYFLVVVTKSITSESITELNDTMQAVEMQRIALGGTRLDGNMDIFTHKINDGNEDVAFVHFATKEDLEEFYESGL